MDNNDLEAKRKKEQVLAMLDKYLEPLGLLGELSGLNKIDWNKGQSQQESDLKKEEKPKHDIDNNIKG